MTTFERLPERFLIEFVMPDLLSPIKVRQTGQKK